jgi:putative endopeptidase
MAHFPKGESVGYRAIPPVVVLLLVAVGVLHAQGAPTPHYPPFGLDLSARDRKVRPGDDFFQHVNGGYLAHTPIPANQSSLTRRSDMTDRINNRLHTILEAAAAHSDPVPADLAGKVGAFYASFMDEAAIEQRGIHPIDAELEAIRSAGNSMELAFLMGRSTVDFYPSPFSVRFDLDLKHTDRYAAYLSQSGLGLPDIDYYDKPDYAAVRDKYRDYAATLLNGAGWPDAKAHAMAILDLETRLAHASWSLVEQRDPTPQYNPVSAAELSALAPQFAWKQYLEGAHLDADAHLIATQNTAFPKIAAVFAATPLDVVKAWMAFRVMDDAAPYLPTAFATARFAFKDQTLGGQSEPAPRWKRAIVAVAGSGCSYAPHSCFGTLKWAVGQLYVEQFFPPATKSQITSIATAVKAAFRRRLEENDWMDPATKAEALKKLDAFAIKVGYPDSWENYSGIYRDAPIRRDDIIADVRAAAEADWTFYVSRSRGPIDRGEWLLAPQENNAYSGALNDIVFPAGILQAPVFDAAADPAINYGAIGAIIGHELTHGFDDEGRSVDSSGALRDWWTPESANTFKARAARLGAQYAQYEPLPGLHINPELTMGENIADLGGLSIALNAYRNALHGRAAPVRAGLTGVQRVFMGWAQAWAGKATPEQIRLLTTGDPHSFRSFRVNGVVRNIDTWYPAFHVKPGDKLYLAPADRVVIW